MVTSNKKSSGSISIPDLSHHAHYLIGGDSAREELVAELNKHHKIQIHGNADFSNRKYEVFTIDDARDLKSDAGTRPVGSSNDGETVKKIFVIQMSGITVEAQNALLKLLEEPADYVHFFLIIPSAHLLLPTVKSRMHLIGGHTKASGHAHNDGVKDDSIAADEAASFLKMSIPKRLDYIKKLVDDISKEKKTKQDTIEFLNAIERMIRVQGLPSRSDLDIFVAIEKARSYMNDRAPSVKMLLEYVALNI